ncbi:MAG: MBL fold metallo-hydrolase [Methylophilus sp.]|uniref:MBL fold metallo-hydrolase n=1 Tax=Methylophilus sp. TaxID=29541 RepID=UPI003FA09645
MKDLYQFFDDESSTYTYLLIDADTKEAVIIDPVDQHLNQYMTLLANEHLKLKLVLETHAHADHITSAGALCSLTGARAATPAHCKITAAEIQLADGQALIFGKQQVIQAIHTPGHTAGAMTYFWNGKLFTGDSLLINGCGRTDFQNGDAGALYDSITRRLFSYPDETLVYPCHDYDGNTFSTIGHERRHNQRIAGRSREEFIRIMDALDLPPPKMIDKAIPANMKLGLNLRHAAGS